MRWRDYDRAKEFRDPEGYSLIWSTLARRSVGSPDATNASGHRSGEWEAEGGRRAIRWQNHGGNGLGGVREWPSSLRGPFLQWGYQHGWQSLGIGQEGAFNRTLVMPEIVS
jgi:hypothetical protein